MNPHFFTAPFSWLSFGSRFRVLVAASPPFFKDGILVSQPHLSKAFIQGQGAARHRG